MTEHRTNPTLSIQMKPCVIAVILAGVIFSAGCTTTHSRATPSDAYPTGTTLSVQKQQTQAALAVNTSGRGFWHDFTILVWSSLACLTASK